MCVRHNRLPTGHLWPRTPNALLLPPVGCVYAHLWLSIDAQNCSPLCCGDCQAQGQQSKCKGARASCHD